MTRSEHVRWSKGRALAHLPGDPKKALESFLIDLRKHKETRAELKIPGAKSAVKAFAGVEPDSVRRFIEGFN